MLIILFIIILIFGANRLPDIGRGIGRGIRNFKEAVKDGNDKPYVSSQRTTRPSPTRRVTRSRSRNSSSGMAYLRLTP